MEQDDQDDRLSKISTIWQMVFQAHGAPADERAAAQYQLLRRYCGAIHRYLLGAVRDPHIADDLLHEFALRLLRGDFRRTDPEKGRFRDFVKTSLFHLVVDYQRRKKIEPRLMLAEGSEPASEDTLSPEADREFLQRWRDELLARTWDDLAAVQQRTGNPLYTVLRFRAEHPKMRSAQMAEELGRQLERPLTAEAVRQMLHRAREKFADLLLEEVARSLEHSSRDRLEQELIDLGLLNYCRSALERLARQS